MTTKDDDLRSRVAAAIKEHAGEALADLLSEQARRVAQLEDDKRYFFDQISAIEEALDGWPRLPSQTCLWALSSRGQWPEDWERGKAMQRELPMSRIPYKTEYELAAGFWDRITAGAWRTMESPAPHPGDKEE